MSIITSKHQNKEAATVNYEQLVSKNLLMIFTRNPELGKCKTRLAATIGNENALTIYKMLLSHTATITENISTTKQVWYSEEIWNDDIWDNSIFEKRLQEGDDLGDRMSSAFLQGFEAGFERIIVIGSDLYDIAQKDIDKAFSELNSSDFVLGPAEDGGYYLLGMTHHLATLFQNKAWGSNTVLKASIENLKNENFHLLPTKNDIDIYDDIKDLAIFQPYLKP